MKARSGPVDFLKDLTKLKLDDRHWDRNRSLPWNLEEIANLNYFRLGVEEELMAFNKDKWRANGREKMELRIRTLTEEYLQQAETQQSLNKIAAKLVELRRQRVEDRERWAKFCEGDEPSRPS